MNVFELRNKVVGDYANYVRSFISIRDPRIRDHVEEELEGGLLWPDPRVGLNPSFAEGGDVEGLVRDGTLHPDCAKVFRLRTKDDPAGRPMRLHKHQVEAIHAARAGRNYVVTTGTGSGKSLTYLVPIVDHVIRNGGRRGVQAIVVYPMNALANSQERELKKFLDTSSGGAAPRVTFRRYTGQESDEEKKSIIADPPDILLTNYVMLELILTRVDERQLVQATRNLRFLVFDELHTYRGRQGADVALLARRARSAFGSEKVISVGTSATMGSSDFSGDPKPEIARVASLLFGDEVEPTDVITESLRRATTADAADDAGFKQSLSERLKPGNPPPSIHSAFVADPLSAWVETVFGIQQGATSLVRAVPRAISGRGGAAEELSKLTGVATEICDEAIRAQLLAGFRIQDPITGFPVFPFRVHQFVSRGDTVYASLEAEASRYLTVHPQKFVPEDRSKVLIPLAFCRECGQEYYSIQKLKAADGERYESRPPEDRPLEDEQVSSGYLYISSAAPWPESIDELSERVPEDWLEEGRTGVRVKSDKRKFIPQKISLTANGRVGPGGTVAWYLPAPFRFCLSCGIVYGGRARRDFGKLGTLGSEGRSTATTIITFSGIRQLRRDPSLSDETRKILSFTDNRQDASLQAGHFNDFVLVGLLRSGLFKALVAAGAGGVSHENLADKVAEALDLPLDLYAQNPEVRFGGLEDTKRALRDVLGYRLYVDLQRGWRITSPNLEQIDLLRFKYRSLDELCRAEDVWASKDERLKSIDPTTREGICRALLDFMRRELCVRVDYLDPRVQEKIVQRSDQHLKEPWELDENEATSLLRSQVLYPGSRPKRKASWQDPPAVYLSARGGFGQYLRRELPRKSGGKKLSLTETEQIIADLLKALLVASLVEQVTDTSDGHVAGYQIPAASITWFAGEGKSTIHDPIRVPRLPASALEPNRFFVDFYRNVASEARGVGAKEHTAQVLAAERERREEMFRTGRLPVLFCSPTMELGVDIAQLNVVSMRNVPPTPANYAQRSGRAGRSGQPALVITYCSGGSGHDQYFFRRPEQMVAGRVLPPRIDLANEDLIRAHVSAVWLAGSGLSLGKSLKDVLDVSGERPSLALLDRVSDDLRREDSQTRAATQAKGVLRTIEPQLGSSTWWTPGWLADALRNIPVAFDAACDRWRTLYRAALAQFEIQSDVIKDASRPAEDKKLARRLRHEAETQMALLTSEDERITQSDFYSYRYFASEGFLPGYSFPRLPLSAFIPARRAAKGEDEYLSRPRFLAIREFGPRNFIYHEGSRYLVNRVILPVGERTEPGRTELSTVSIKRCGSCGYLHVLSGGAGPDLCEHCHEALEPALHNLFRLQNVVTRRRDRINSDEEERQRQGYEIQSAIRFAEVNGNPVRLSATVDSEGGPFASLSYGHAATIWRVNLGWKRRTKGSMGFHLDTERGYWVKDPASVEDEGEDDPVSRKVQKVLPYVEDRRNCLIVSPSERPDAALLASLQAALKSAIQIEFQLEDGELVAEPLPNEAARQRILFFEAAEGGAGVLRRVIEEPDAIRRVARRALELCHFNPETGEDRGGPPWRKELCEAACYDCLMSYTNQPDHKLLDRKLVGPVLRRLANATVNTSPTASSREDHAERLRLLSGSALERKWLEMVMSGGHRLPSDAQTLIESAGTRPDFVYRDQHAVIYVDGPPHDYPDRQERDQNLTQRLEDLGYTVIRFRHSENWPATTARYPHVFGKPA